MYTVLAIGADDFRLLDDTGRPYLFPAECFAVVEAQEPAHWVCKTGEDGERYCSPREWSEPGFFEDYFDGVAAARSVFWKVYDRCYRAEAEHESV